MVLKITMFDRRVCNSVAEMGEDAAAIEAALSGLEAEYDEAATEETDPDSLSESPEPPAAEPVEEDPASVAEGAADTEDTGDGDDTSAAAEAAGDGEDGAGSDRDLATVAVEYGLTPEMAENFSSIEEMKRWVAVHDQLSRAEHQRRVPTQPETAQPEPTAKPPEPKREPEARAETTPQWDERLKKLEEAGYEGEVLEVLRDLAQRDAAKDEAIAKLRQEREAEQAAQAQQQTEQQQLQFFDYLDRIGEADLFGQEGQKPTEKQNENVGLVYEELKEKLDAGHKLTAGLVERAARAVFYKHFEHKAKVGHTKAVKKQSNNRMGSSRNDKPLDNAPFEGDIEDDPVIQKKIREFREANGEI